MDVTMKKATLLLAALLTLAALTACGTPQKAAMQLSASEFSDETTQVLGIVQDELAFFDYSIDDTVKSCSIDFWMFQDGQWINLGKVSGKAGAGQHRVAVRMTDSVCELYQMEEEGYTKSSYPVSAGLNDCSSTGGSRLETVTAIEPDKEMVLWAMFGSNAPAMSLGNLDDFRTTECDAGLAATITFSK